MQRRKSELGIFGLVVTAACGAGEPPVTTPGNAYQAFSGKVQRIANFSPNTTGIFTRQMGQFEHAWAQYDVSETGALYTQVAWLVDTTGLSAGDIIPQAAVTAECRLTVPVTLSEVDGYAAEDVIKTTFGLPTIEGCPWTLEEGLVQLIDRRQSAIDSIKNCPNLLSRLGLSASEITPANTNIYYDNVGPSAPIQSYITANNEPKITPWGPGSDGLGLDPAEADAATMISLYQVDDPTNAKRAVVYDGTLGRIVCGN